MCSEFKKFNPDLEMRFEKGADAALELNKKNAEKAAEKEQKKEQLLVDIMEARKEAEASGDYKEVTRLLADLVAMAKIDIKRQTATAEQAK